MVTTVETAAVHELLQAWPVDVRSVAPLDGRGDMWVVTTSTAQSCVLKNVGGVEMLARTEVHYSVTRHLHRAGVAVAYLMATREGSFFAAGGEEIFVLMPFLPGERVDFYHSDAAPAYCSLGRALGQLHVGLAAYPGRVDTWRIRLYDRVFENSAPRLRLKLQGEDRRRLDAVLAEVEGPLKAASSNLPDQPIFWDCHTGNIRMKNGAFTGFVDCDYICIGPRICDVANMLANLAIRGLEKKRSSAWLGHFPELLRGYDGVVERTRVERESLWLAMLAFGIVRAEYLHRMGPAEMAGPVLEALHWVFEQRERVEEASLETS